MKHISLKTNFIYWNLSLYITCTCHEKQPLTNEQLSFKTAFDFIFFDFIFYDGLRVSLITILSLLLPRPDFPLVRLSWFETLFLGDNLGNVSAASR